MAARGLIIVIPLLIAAGVAVYESPQVRQFIDEHRRKLALALNDLGDQFSAPSGSQAGSQRAAPRRRSSRDAAAAREDQSPEAEEKRQMYREELAERRRMAEERRSRPSLGRRGSSFDDLVDADGNLRGVASGLENGAMEMGMLRRRHNETAGAALGSTFANPFADEMHMDSNDRGVAMSDEDLARQLQAHYDEEYASSQRTDARDDAPLTQREVQELERIVREEAERQGKELPEPGSNFRMSEDELLHNLQQFQVELTESEAASDDGRRTPITSATPSTRTLPRTPASESASLDAEGILVEAAPSTHPSEALLVDLTPTTSAPGTPRQGPRQPLHQQSYNSIQDWAEQSTAASFHSLYDASEAAPRSTRSDVSDLESVAAPSEHEVSDLDFISERGLSTPGTWTEVGSVVSSEDHHEQQQQQQQPHQH